MAARSMVSAFSLAAAIASALPACSTKPAAGVDSVRAGESAGRISAGMTRLGASPKRSACFARKIASELNAQDANEAIGLIDRSSSKEEMRNGVLAASEPVKQSFIRASFGCSLFD